MTAAMTQVPVPMTTVGELFSYDIINEIPMERVLLSEKEQNKYLVKKGDLLFARQSLVASGAGKCSIVNDIIEPTTFESHLIRVRLDEKMCCSLYYYYLFKLPDNPIKAIINQCAQAGIRGSELQNIKVPFPSLYAQRTISSILYAYDNLIENNTRRIRLLEQMAENLYKEWFVRFRFPGHENAEFENGLPRGWRIGRLYEYGRIETGKTPSMLKQEYYGGDHLFIKTPDMHGNMFVRETEETLSDKGNLSQPKKLLPIGSIMVSCIGSSGVGAVAINAKEGHTNQQINSIILSSKDNLEWLYFTCKALKPMIELYGATGATMTNLSKGKFERLKVVEPSFDLRKLFHIKTKSIFDEILKLDENITILSRQRDLLLPRLMSGKLEVNV
jgi:type I restriction enzyme S subunit